MLSRGRARSQERPVKPQASSHGTAPASAMDGRQGDRWRGLMRQAARERLLGVAAQSRGFASGAGTRMSPSMETAQERVQRWREQPRRRQDQQSLPPMIPIVLAAVAGLLVTVILLRLRRAALAKAELDDMDILVDVAVVPTEMGVRSGLPSDDLIVVRQEQ